MKEMDDDLRRKQLSKFRRTHPVGKHHVGKYHYDEITLPSGEKRNILRRIEKGKVDDGGRGREKREAETGEMPHEPRRCR